MVGLNLYSLHGFLPPKPTGLFEELALRMQIELSALVLWTVTVTLRAPSSSGLFILPVYVVTFQSSLLVLGLVTGDRQLSIYL